MIRLLLFFAFVVLALGACLVAVKSNGATDHPLLVDAAAPIQAPMLFVPCPLNRKNLPSAQKREA